MKAMVLTGPNLPFELVQRPDPAAGPGEAVARVITCGAGLTIQHAKAGRRKVQFPRIIGHEITGEIVETGAGRARAQGRRRGDHLFLSQLRPLPLVPHQPRAAVREQRRPGRAGMRRRLCRIRQAAGAELHQAAGGLDHKKHPAEIGVVTDALATPYKVLSRARVKAGETVAVIGAGGGLGIHQLMMAKWAKARVIAVDTKPEKFAACRKAGADEWSMRAPAASPSN